VVSQARPRSAAGYVQFAASGTGYYCYTPASNRWARPDLVYGLERAARRFATANPGIRFGIGDASLQEGGAIPGHQGHVRGDEVDVRPVRTDGQETAVSVKDAAYSRARTLAVVTAIRAECRLAGIGLNDTGIPGVTPFPGVDTCMHLKTR